MGSAKHASAGDGSPWKIYAAGGVVCALLSAGAYAFGARPAIARYDAHLEQQAELKAARQKAANLLGTLNNSRTQLAATTDALSNLTLRLEPATTINQRISRLTALANATNLKIDEMRPGAVTEGSDYQTVPILIAGSGTYRTCAQFLRELRKQFPDTAVRSFETNANGASPESTAATFQFDLIWHAAKD